MSSTLFTCLITMSHLIHVTQKLVSSVVQWKYYWKPPIGSI